MIHLQGTSTNLVCPSGDDPVLRPRFHFVHVHVQTVASRRSQTRRLPSLREPGPRYPITLRRPAKLLRGHRAIYVLALASCPGIDPFFNLVSSPTQISIVVVLVQTTSIYDCLSFLLRNSGAPHVVSLRRCTGKAVRRHTQADLRARNLHYFHAFTCHFLLH